MEFSHYPVLHQEILNIIIKKQPRWILDCTFGLGGHTKLFLQNTGAIIWAIDRDPKVLPWVEKLQQEFPHRLFFINKSFGEGVKDLMEKKIIFDYVLGDFGLSSMQIDDPQRGFSFSQNGPLSMSMDGNSTKGLWLINESPVGFLANIIKKYGEERNYYEIAKNIVNHRPLHTTQQLRKSIEEKIIQKNFTNKTLARVFQSIRIYTNNELEEIDQLLNVLPTITNSHSIFHFIYFHSLEGEPVYQWAKKMQRKFTVIYPSPQELVINSRSKSAILIYIK